MNRPLREQPHELPVAVVTADIVFGTADLAQRQQLRSGQQRGRREVKTAARRRKRRRMAQRRMRRRPPHLQHSTQSMKGPR